MKSFRVDKGPAFCFRAVGLLFLFALAPALIAAQPVSAVVLWDGKVSAPFAANANRSDWKRVPSDLLTLEANPPKASSDPGYYGREYRFSGAAVVENQKLLAAFDPGTGRMVLYAKPGGTAPGSGESAQMIEVLELAPAGVSNPVAQISIVRNVNDEVVLELAYPGVPKGAVVFSFGRDAILEVKPSPELKSFTVTAPLSYAILPSFIGDDLIYGPQEEQGSEISVPSENLLLGLVKGEGAQFVMTWPNGKQQVRLGLAEGSGSARSITSVHLQNVGQSFFLAPMAAPGIWHREALTAAFLEKDVPLAWKRPFPARWKTQLFEETLKTTFAFRTVKGDIWRGVPGSYDYPVWFDGDQTFFHLSKKVPPRGESLIYFLESQATPDSIQTPVDILKSTLGRVVAERILDVPGRKLRTHHRRGDEGVHRACTCGCTEAIQTIFEAGEEVDRQADIKGDLDDMMYFVQHHVGRIGEYRHFAEEMVRYLESQRASAPALREYLENLEQIVQQIPQEYSVQEQNMKSSSYADELVKRTIALTEKKDPNNLKAYLELLKDWRAMGGAQDYVVAQCHNITRKLAQEAGYGCASLPQAVTVAQEVRARARQCLRNPDGYEIWADY
jgi:hypothetical protein